ncbi:MAG: DUF503 domain-containing protein [Chloroflexi bacterium]|nr:DUF503 domain-containing protein [Chloroflexota bacterium]
MVVGMCRVLLFLTEQPNSLKGKRSVINRLRQRLSSRYPVAIAEVGRQDVWQEAEIGFAVVNEKESLVREMIQKILEELERDYPVEIEEKAVDFQPF